MASATYMVHDVTTPAVTGRVDATSDKLIRAMRDHARRAMVRILEVDGDGSAYEVAEAVVEMCEVWMGEEA
jgi:hypothetical protein